MVQRQRKTRNKSIETIPFVVVVVMMPPSNIDVSGRDSAELSRLLPNATDDTNTLSPSSPRNLVEPSLYRGENNKSSSIMSNVHGISSSINFKAIGACSLYSFCSVSMILVNKSLASSYNHLIDGNLNILLVVFQAVVAVVCVETCKHLKWVEYPSLTLETAKAWGPVNIFFCLMLFTGMASLQTNSVPMVTVFKNVTNIITTAGDFAFFGSKPETLAVAAFGVMLLGAVAAAKNDVHVTFSGLFWMMANCFSTASYVLYMKFATKTIKMSKFGMVYVNNVLCALFLLPVAWYMGEVDTFLNAEAIHTFDYALKNFFAGFVGFFLNFASLNCVSVTGPTTYAITGSLNKIPVAFLGWIMFDSVITAKTWFFIAVSMLGGFLYSFAKIQSARAKGTRSNSK